MRRAAKFFALMLALVLTLGTLGADSVMAAETSGTEAETVPEGYTAIRTVDELYAIRNKPSENYILMNDIDLSVVTSPGGDLDNKGTGWEPIETFSGTLDGNGHRINGMHIRVENETVLKDDMITASKARIHGMLAYRWVRGFMTRPNMRKKWGRGPMNSECWAGLWKLRSSVTIRNRF